MHIYVVVKLKSKKQYIKKINKAEYEVAVKELPINGKANKAVIKALAQYFKLSQSQVSIVSGQKSRKKIIKVDV